MLETNGRFKDAAEISTNRGTIRAVVKNPANKTFLIFGSRVQFFHVCVILTCPSKDERRAILKHRCKVPAIYT